jgi:hypothetical protein
VRTSWSPLRRRPRRHLWLAVASGLLCVPQAYFQSRHIQDGCLALLAYPRLYGAFALWWWLVRELGALPAAAAAQPAARADVASSSRTT